MQSCDLAIVGGGASGLAAAVCALDVNPSLRVLVLERHERVGRKLLATGNGRCNLTNIGGFKGRYHGAPAFAAQVLSQFDAQKTLDFFERLGIPCICSEKGKMYPLCLQASAVLDQLRLGAEERGAQLICSCEVKEVKRVKKGFELKTSTGIVHTARVLLSTGGKASAHLSSDGLGYSLLTQLGHPVTPLFPSIVQIKTRDPLRALKGIKVEARVTVEAAGERKSDQGEVLFTEYGLSGPPILQLSRLISAAGGGEVTLDLLPSISRQQFIKEIQRRRTQFCSRTLENLLIGLLPRRLAQAVLKYAQILPLSRKIGSLSERECRALASAIQTFTLHATGPHSWQSAQVTAGGACTDSFSPKTLESKKVPGLYAAGEVLNVDGDCGGFNLQWAWATGALAGRSAAGEEKSHA